MTMPGRLAFVGNSLPRRCGIATFTTDLQQAVAQFAPEMDTCIVAMNDHHNTYDYPPIVRLQIQDSDLADYERAADFRRRTGPGARSRTARALPHALAH